MNTIPELAPVAAHLAALGLPNDKDDCLTFLREQVRLVLSRKGWNPRANRLLATLDGANPAVGISAEAMAAYYVSERAWLAGFAKG